MKVHELRMDPFAFTPLAEGLRHVLLLTGEYAPGDLLVVREYDAELDEPETGRWRAAFITHVIGAGSELGAGLREGYAALSVRIFRRPRSI